MYTPRFNAMESKILINEEKNVQNNSKKIEIEEIETFSDKNLKLEISKDLNNFNVRKENEKKDLKDKKYINTNEIENSKKSNNFENYDWDLEKILVETNNEFNFEN